MAIQGFRTTENFADNQRPKHWRQSILLRDPNGDTPLYALTNLLKSESVDDAEFNWWEKEFPSRRVALSANLTTSNNEVSVTSGASLFKAGDILRVEESDEHLMVTQDPTTDTKLVVQRAFAGTTATAVAYAGTGINPNLLNIGSAFEEGSMPPTGVNRDPTRIYNYTQIFRDTLEMTRTATKTRLRTPGQVNEAKRECLKEFHAPSIERAIIWGKRSLGFKNGKPRRTMNGIISHIPSDNVKNAGGNLDMETFEEYSRLMFQWGSTEKMGFCGDLALTGLQQVVRRNSNFQLMNMEEEYGMKIRRFCTPHGILVLKRHPLFTQFTGGTTGTGTYYGFNSSILVVDQANLKWRYFSGDDTRYEPKLEVPGLDGMQAGYITEAGLEVHHAKTHFLINEFAAGVADS